jgi:hypothetical protein
MSNFLVRVVLHAKTDLTHPSYTALHEAMEKGGFSRKIISALGISYHLPPAEYRIDGVYTLDALHTKVKNIVDTIDTDNGILISQHDNKTIWSGLKT